MQPAALPRPLGRFVADVDALVGAEDDEARFLPEIGLAMGRLIGRDDWLDPAFAQPHPVHYRQYLLYADPADRYSVVSFVWGPGQHTPIHDHTVWGVIGVLRGAELTQTFDLDADGRPVAAGDAVRQLPGSVEFVSPRIGDIHQVSNALADSVSISIHAYGANIGKVRRHVFSQEGGAPKVFVSGYSNDDVS